MEHIAQVALQLYQSADEDNNGTIDYSEARQLLSNILDGASEDTARQLAYLCDFDGDGRIDFGEFKQLLYICSVSDVTDFKSAMYHALDLNMNGQIGWSELKASRPRLLKYMAEATADELIALFKGQKAIKFNDFAAQWDRAIARNGAE